jgi:hypothetical protein
MRCIKFLVISHGLAILSTSYFKGFKVQWTVHFTLFSTLRHNSHNKNMIRNDDKKKVIPFSPLQRKDHTKPYHENENSCIFKNSSSFVIYENNGTINSSKEKYIYIYIYVHNFSICILRVDSRRWYDTY